MKPQRGKDTAPLSQYKLCFIQTLSSYALRHLINYLRKPKGIPKVNYCVRDLPNQSEKESFFLLIPRISSTHAHCIGRLGGIFYVRFNKAPRVYKVRLARTTSYKDEMFTKE